MKLTQVLVALLASVILCFTACGEENIEVDTSEIPSEQENIIEQETNTQEEFENNSMENKTLVEENNNVEIVDEVEPIFVEEMGRYIFSNQYDPNRVSPAHNILLEDGNTLPLIGEFSTEHSGFIISVNGIESNISELNKTFYNYQGTTRAIKVESYSVVSKIDHDFLMTKAGEYTSENYPCLVGEELGDWYEGPIGTAWNKERSWSKEGNVFVEKVRMVDSFSEDEPQDYYELWYDGNSGKFIKEITYPEKGDFCN